MEFLLRIGNISGADLDKESWPVNLDELGANCLEQRKGQVFFIKQS